MANVWSDSWESLGESEREGGVRSTRLPRGERIGATVYEYPPGAGGTPGAYHFHHAAEELLVVLRGRPTLRTPAGERELDEGEVVHFPRGSEGAHSLANRTDEPVRVLFASNREGPEIVEYPDLGQVTAQSRLPSQRGSPLFVIHDLAGTGDELEG